MTSQVYIVDHPEDDAVAADWLAKLNNKVISSVRPGHVTGPVPDVTLTFVDGTSAFITVQPDVYFEGCLNNTLRRSQPIVRIFNESYVNERDRKVYQLEVGSATFPLLILRAEANVTGQFPFILSMRP